VEGFSGEENDWMAPTWNEYENLPFAPGTSPFHIKGIAYRGHVDYANKYIPGGSAAVNATFRDPALVAFFEQPFLAASWYDALPILPVWYACAQVLKESPIEFLKKRTRHQAKDDINGVYRLILKLASPETVALRMPRAVGKYFDFGTTDARLVRPGVVRMEQTGLPLLMAPWFGIVGEAFLSVALEIAGAKRILVRRLPTEPVGKAHGLPLGRMVADVEFEGASLTDAERSPSE
jgi:hypothetical protein